MNNEEMPIHEALMLRALVRSAREMYPEIPVTESTPFEDVCRDGYDISELIQSVGGIIHTQLLPNLWDWEETRKQAKTLRDLARLIYQKFVDVVEPPSASEDKGLKLPDYC